MSTISAKCTKNTTSLIHTILKTDPFFNDLYLNFGVIVNPSWLCKFSIGCLLNNIDIVPSKISSTFAYDCHYVDKFDDILFEYIKNIKKV